MRDDPNIFEVWADFVVAGEKLSSYGPDRATTDAERVLLERGQRLLANAREIVLAITRARVPMPKSSKSFIERCRAYQLALGSGELDAPPESLRMGRLGFALNP